MPHSLTKLADVRLIRDWHNGREREEDDGNKRIHQGPLDRRGLASEEDQEARDDDVENAENPFHRVRGAAERFLGPQEYRLGDQLLAHEAKPAQIALIESVHQLAIDQKAHARLLVAGILLLRLWRRNATAHVPRS